MTSRWLAAPVAMLALAVARPAAADSHKLMVLQSEGRVDAATRAKIDAAIVKLALAAEPRTTPGELNFTDAATAVGCKPDTAVCKDEVLSMLAVDEIVITTVAPKPGGIEIAVRRVQKGGASREATMLLATGTPPDRLDGIATVFADAPPPAAPIAPTAPAVTTAPGPAPRTDGEPPVIPAPTAVKPAPPSPVATPAPTEPVLTDEPNPRRHRLELAGMAGGAGLLVIGVALWGAASSVQGDIDKAPTTTQQDLASLRDLESRGDAYAAIGNLAAISGLAVGGVATYFYLKDRRTSSATARLAPSVLDHGVGLTLTIGGAP